MSDVRKGDDKQPIEHPDSEIFGVLKLKRPGEMTMKVAVEKRIVKGDSQLFPIPEFFIKPALCDTSLQEACFQGEFLMIKQKSPAVLTDICCNWKKDAFVTFCSFL